MYVLTIERKSEDQVSEAQAKALRKERGRAPSRRGSKGREFSATMLGYVLADSMWKHGRSSDSRRPVFLYLTGPATSLRPFLANLQALAYRLTLQKIAAAQQAQGQDWRATLAAAGLLAAGEGA